MSLERIPANTSWGRLQGDFRIVESVSGTQLEWHDPSRDDRYVIVFADHPPPEGPAMITGQVSQHQAATGNVRTIVADDPVVPPVDEPIWLYLTPAVLAIVIAIGLRLGYPVKRRDRATPSARVGAPPTGGVPPAANHAPSEPVPGDWSGRIESVAVARDRPLACTIAVDAVPSRPLHGGARVAPPWSRLMEPRGASGATREAIGIPSRTIGRMTDAGRTAIARPLARKVR